MIQNSQASYNTLLTNNLIKNANASDELAQVYDKLIEDNIAAYYRTLSDIEIEIIKFFNYFHRKFDGNIQVPIKNLMNRFNLQRSWIMELLKRLYDRGLIVTFKAGYGRKVTRRIFTARAFALLKYIFPGKINKHDIHRNSGHYSGHYSGASTNNISSKVNNISKQDDFRFTENDIRSASEAFLAMKKMLKSPDI